jgi:hypothetical protein
LEDSVQKATALNSRYLGKISKIEKIRNIILVFLGIVSVTTTIVFGVGDNGLGAFFALICYLFLVFMSLYTVRMTTSILLRNG